MKRPVHPGEVLREEFLVPFKLTHSQLAAVLKVPTSRVNQIVNEHRGVTADTALRLARALGTSPEFWLNLQASYELRKAELELGKALKRIKPLKAS